ncbi:hypothetical protein D3C80_1452400 [compost metagenome]
MSQRTNGGHQYHRLRSNISGRAFNIQEFLRTKIGTKSGFCNYIICQGHTRLGSNNRVCSLCNVGKRSGMYNRRIAFQGLHQVRFNGIFQQDGHSALCFQITGKYRLAVVGIANENIAQSVFQIFKIFSKAHDCHYL